jgi:hypothetical protein
LSKGLLVDMTDDLQCVRRVARAVRQRLRDRGRGGSGGGGGGGDDGGEHVLGGAANTVANRGAEPEGTTADVVRLTGTVLYVACTGGAQGDRQVPVWLAYD